MQGLQQKVFTLATILHLGIELGQTGDNTLRKTLQKINLKALKHCILPQLHPQTHFTQPLINSAMVLLYNHVLMALHAIEETSPIHKEIPFLWMRKVETKTVQKRRLLASTHFSVRFGKGGLKIQYPRKWLMDYDLISFRSTSEH